MDDDYSNAPAQRSSAPANASSSAPRQAARPAPNFSDMDDDIPF
jgi:single-strand DNA-binding protein